MPVSPIPLAEVPPPFPPRPPYPPLPEVRVQPPLVFVEQRWEYRHLVRDLAAQSDQEDSELNALGAAGWELVTVLSDGTRAHFYLKREVR